jgi:hypothetical protein
VTAHIASGVVARASRSRGNDAALFVDSSSPGCNRAAGRRQSSGDAFGSGGIVRESLGVTSHRIGDLRRNGGGSVILESSGLGSGGLITPLSTPLPF